MAPNTYKFGGLSINSPGLKAKATKSVNFDVSEYVLEGTTLKTSPVSAWVLVCHTSGDCAWPDGPKKLTERFWRKRRSSGEPGLKTEPGKLK